MKEKQRSIILHHLATLLFVAILFSLLWLVFIWKNFDARVWRAPSPIVFTTKMEIICDTILQCNLVPGDILVRRYITSRTRIPALLFGAHYTHASYYLGDGKIVEAFGRNRSDSSQEIRSTTLMHSDWVDAGIEEIVIIRPSYKADSFHIISEKLKAIANDPTYYFGIPNTSNEKKTTCAALIVDALHTANMIDISANDLIVTPDYLVMMALRDQSFDVLRVRY